MPSKAAVKDSTPNVNAWNLTYPIAPIIAPVASVDLGFHWIHGTLSMHDRKHP
jgi:hypothetical protein